MTTRYEDGVSVLGTENKSLVDEIEREFQNKSIERSEIAELITRSIEEVNGIPQVKSEVELAKTLETLGKPELIKMFFKLTSDGKITEDELTKEVSYMANALTSKTNENQEVSTSNAEVIETKSDYVTKADLESVVNSKFDKLKDELINEIKGLKIQPQAATETVVEAVEPVSEVSESKSIALEVEKLIESAVTKSEVERKQSYQNVLDFTAGKLVELENKLTGNKPSEPVQNSEVTELKSMVQNIQAESNLRFGELNQIIGNLVNQVGQVLANKNTPVPQSKQPVKLPAPVSRAHTTPQPVPQPMSPFQPGKPMKIGEIALRSTLGGR